MSGPTKILPKDITLEVDDVKEDVADIEKLQSDSDEVLEKPVSNRVVITIPLVGSDEPDIEFKNVTFTTIENVDEERIEIRGKSTKVTDFTDIKVSVRAVSGSRL